MNVFQSQARQFEAALSNPDLPPAAARDLLPLFQRFHTTIEECLGEEDWCSPELLHHLEEIESALQADDVDEARTLLRAIHPLFNRKHLRDSAPKRVHHSSPASRLSLPQWLAPATLLGAASVLVLATMHLRQGGHEKHIVQEPAAVERLAEHESPPAALIPVSTAALKAEGQPAK